MNFRRRRPRESTPSSHRWDWSTWKASSLIRKLFRESGVKGKARPLTRDEVLRELAEDEAAMWEEYLREFGEEENW